MSRVARLLALFSLTFSVSLWAGQFSVNPVRVQLTPDNRIAVMRVTNQDSAPVTLQLKTLAWSQADNADVLTETRDFLATPPLFTLAPGQEQIVRVGLRHTPSSGIEQPYRLIFEEVLPPAEAGFQGLRVALNISIPVFATMAENTAASPVWSLKRQGKDVVLHVANRGTAHMQLRGITLHTPPLAQAAAQIEGNFYVLPGQSRHWPVALPRQARSVRLTAQTPGGETQIDLALDAP
jgi:fimbrial chaperone protein